MKINCSIILFFTLTFASCLQASMEEKLFEYMPVAENIKSRYFSCDGNNDLLIVNIYGGTLQTRLIPSYFSLSGYDASLVPIRAGDSCVLFSFKQPLKKGSNYSLTIKPQAVQAGDFPRMIVVKAVTSGQITVVERTGFDNSVIQSLCYGNGYFFAVGDSGKMSYSADAAGNWTNVRAGEAQDGNKFTDTIYDIAVNDYGFYAVGAGARMSWANMITGINEWNGHKIPNSSVYGESMFGGRIIRAIEYGKGADSSSGRYVAAGDGGNTIFRWDLDEWRKGEGINYDNMITTLAFGNTGGDGIFIAGGYSPDQDNDTINHSCLYWAADGMRTQNWTGTNSFFGDNIIRCSAYGNGVFVIGGDSGKLSWSPDGKEWTEVTSSPFVTHERASGVLSIAFGSGVFIAGGHDGIMAVSIDGIYWNTLQLKSKGFESNEQINGIISDGRGKFAAAGNRYGDNRSKIISWYQKPPAQEVSDAFITINGWSAAASTGMSNSEIRGIAWNGSKYIAAGEGKIASSTNGTSWSEVTSYSGIFFRDVVWGNDKFVAVGYRTNQPSGIGVIAVSNENGENWTLYTAPALTASLGSNIEMTVDPKIYGVSFANGTFVAAGERGWSAWSTNGTTWNPVWISPFSQFEQPSNVQDALAIATDGLRFVVGGTRGKLAWSSNGGRSWVWIANSLLDSEYNDILSIAYGDGKFIAAGSNGMMKSAGREQLSSASGWQTENRGMYADINAVIWGGGSFLAVGNSGSVWLYTGDKGWERKTGTGWEQNEDIYSAACGNRFITAGKGKIIYSE